MYMCRFMFSQSRSDSEEKNWGVWREKTKKKKKIDLPHSAVLQPLGVCKCLAVFACAPNCRGATKWTNLFPLLFWSETRLMCNGREEGTAEGGEMAKYSEMCGGRCKQLVFDFK